MDKTPEELRRAIESLDAIQDVVRPVVEHFKKLSSIPRDQQTSQQKLWLLAYSAVDRKMSAGTESAMVEVLHLVPILHETIS